MVKPTSKNSVMFSEQLQGPSYLWEHHPCNTVSGTLPILLPEELHDERNVQLVAKQRNAPKDDAGQEAVDELQSEKVGDEYLEETIQTIDDEFGLQESEDQLDEQDEYEDEYLEEAAQAIVGLQESEQLNEQDEYEDEDLDEDNDDDEDEEENEEEDDDEASSVEEQRVDDALEVSTTTDITVASSSSNIDRVKALAAAIAGVSPSPRAPRGRADDGRASWAKIKTIQRFTNDGVNHPQYVLSQSSEED
jgi:hypothetical protein